MKKRRGAYSHCFTTDSNGQRQLSLPTFSATSAYPSSHMAATAGEKNELGTLTYFVSKTRGSSTFGSSSKMSAYSKNSKDSQSSTRFETASISDDGYSIIPDNKNVKASSVFYDTMQWIVSIENSVTALSEDDESMYTDADGYDSHSHATIKESEGLFDPDFHETDDNDDNGNEFNSNREDDIINNDEHDGDNEQRLVPEFHGTKSKPSPDKPKKKDILYYPEEPMNSNTIAENSIPFEDEQSLDNVIEKYHEHADRRRQRHQELTGSAPMGRLSQRPRLADENVSFNIHASASTSNKNDMEDGKVEKVELQQMNEASSIVASDDEHKNKDQLSHSSKKIEDIITVDDIEPWTALNQRLQLLEAFPALRDNRRRIATEHLAVNFSSGDIMEFKDNEKDSIISAKEVENDPLQSIDESINGKVSLWIYNVAAIKVDVLVTPGTTTLDGGGGTIDFTVHSRAGDKFGQKVKTLCQGCGGSIEPGQIVLTKGFDLPSRLIAHAVVGNLSKESEISDMYDRIFELRDSETGNRFSSFVIPCLGYGEDHNSIPDIQAARWCVQAVRRFLSKPGNKDHIFRIIIATEDAKSNEMVEQLMTKYFPCPPIQATAATSSNQD